MTDNDDTLNDALLAHRMAGVLRVIHKTRMDHECADCHQEIPAGTVHVAAGRSTGCVTGRYCGGCALARWAT